MDTGRGDVVEPQSWHHGLVARWWSMFRVAGPEIAYFRGFVESGQPALDLACGAGRLLLPYVEAGLDVEGCDASPEMLAFCAQAADATGASPRLYCQPMHELALPRKYRTIYVCGGLGLGSTRTQDQQALRRIFEHLERGGRLVLDNEVPYSDATHWSLWPRGQRGALPEAPQTPTHRQRGPDGDEYALQARMLNLDPIQQQEVWETHAYQWRDGSLIAEEIHQLTANLYFAGELVLMLERAGFTSVEVRGQYNNLPPTSDDDFLVYVAQRE